MTFHALACKRLGIRPSLVSQDLIFYKQMKTYELSYIISPEMTSEEAEAKAKEIESAIQTREGVILKQLNPVAKTLSYQIKKRASGYFGVLEFQLEPEKLLEVKDIVTKDKKIVRNILIIKEAAEFKKQRRTRETVQAKLTPALEMKQKVEANTEKEEVSEPAEAPEEKSEPKAKVELKDIEHQLEEILGE